LWVVRDISDLKRAEKELRESEQRYRTLVESAPEAIVLYCVTERRFVDANENACKLFGMSRQELLANHFTSLSPPVQPDGSCSATVFERRIAETLVGASSVFEWRYHQPDGTTIHSETQLVRCSIGGREMIRGSIADTMLRSELQRRERRAERLASLGTLAAGIAHEINNPVGAAWTAAETALAVQLQPGREAMLTECLHIIATSMLRCRQIVQNVLRFAREEASAKRPEDINRIVTIAVDTTRHYARQRGASVSLETADTLPAIALSEVEIEQVLVNLIRNAIQSGENVEVTLRITGSPDAVAIEVIDNGRGMTQRDAERVFDPFYSLRRNGTGTGLGLAIAHEIVADHGGSIQVLSALGQGTTVKVTLPLRCDENQVAARRHAKSPHRLWSSAGNFDWAVDLPIQEPD
jgi:PAS domain S-box-containing protein